MGTVGLSFGSPTSGAGFNVSSTVAEIVSNLQNVENPWQTQLTALESQNTVISNLGTLFSNLSNDMSSLTDLEGVLAEKEGSSSNTNVLELTAASSSATAGTHTVTVNSLAQTASGYLAEIADSSNALSGQITLQMGDGTAETFVMGDQPSSGAAANTTYTGSGAATLASLASAINSSGVGITANVESDSEGSWLSLTSGTSGATGNITVSGNTLAATGQILGYTGTTGSITAGSLAAVGSSSDTLSGSISIQVGNGTTETVVIGAEPSSGAAANSVYTGSGADTLADLETTIAGLGVSTSLDSTGTILTLDSGSSSALTVNSNIVDTDSSTLGYTSSVTGVDANLTIDGKSNIQSASNTVSNLIPGLTFQLLSSSSTPVQIVIGNDNTDVESTVNQFVIDYNSLISAINTQEGNTSSGTSEPLFGSPTLSLLQQQLLSSLNRASPDGYLDPVSSTAGTTLSGSISISQAGGLPLYYSGTGAAGTLAPINNAGDMLSGSISITVGSGTAQTINVGDSSTPDTLAGLAEAIGLAIPGVTAQVENNATSSWLSLSSGTAGTLSVVSSITDISPQTIQVPTTSGNNTLAGLASAINSSLSGVTAAVVTTNGESTLTLMSQTEGTNGALTVTSALSSTVPTPLSYSDTGGYTDTTPDVGTLGAVANANDTLSGSLAIQVGSGTVQTVTLDSSDNTLSGLLGAINGLSGVSAEPDQAGTGLTLTSGTNGESGALTVTSNIVDTTSPATTALNYNSSSDINSLTSLGISVNDDGSLTFDANSLDAVLNSDYNSVVGFFQNANSWGQTFTNMLTNAGTGSSTGILSLAQSSNSSTESTLNAEISNENSLISAEQSSLTTELNNANEVLEELPSQLNGMNELYSAITGYDQNLNG